MKSMLSNALGLALSVNRGYDRLLRFEMTGRIPLVHML